ncbi:hypothetical protein [Shewanella sp. KT0246]|uniref:hypothetical protein n=1 Tax=Shewanella sp. KT0246 TaxID=2815912 RepID=UPI001BC0AB27|nr:hypothetical protein [Shewanella sp. KT0246]GIU53038.1 hypothetical protein TUM4249_26790 [Shewanella sp. KT0246]
MLPIEQSPFNKVTIIGNANGDWAAANHGYTIIFNGTVATGNQIINVCNGPYAGSTEDFVVTGEHSQWLTKQLSRVAKELETKLQCWPSSGLVCFVLFSQLGIELSLSRMSLLPSLNRGSALSESEHLPCVVHNWLGERRIAIEYHLNAKDIKIKGNFNQANWPELLLLEETETYKPSPVESQEQLKLLTSINNGDEDPFTQIMHLSEQNHKTKSGILNLGLLSQLPLSIWLKYLSQQKLLVIEQLFFNQSPETSRGFWYLSDNEASAYLDPIRLKLALCQQHLLGYN